MLDQSGYKFLIPFLKTYLPVGFKDINPNDPVILDMEDRLGVHNQFINVADLIILNFIYHSKNFKDYFGIEPDKGEPSIYFSATHPDDLQRHGVARTKYLKLGTDIFNNKSGEVYMSTNLRIRNHAGVYPDLLFQAFIFFSKIPYPSAFALTIHTDISKILKIKHGYHYYVGNDPLYFRFPDEKLLMTGNIFSDREFDIIKGLAKGFSSQQIAESLFLSIHTVNTHRRNILSKTSKTSTYELIMDLKERGVI